MGSVNEMVVDVILLKFPAATQTCYREAAMSTTLLSFYYCFPNTSSVVVDMFILDVL